MMIGDYVRTKHRNEYVIRKVINIIHDDFMEDNHIIFDKPTKYQYYVEDDKQYISSPKIIDLIQIGDYVNGYKVLEIEKDYLFDYTEEINVLIVQNGEVYEVAKKIYSDGIKSIVTKEQFSQMEYKVNE